MSEITKKDKLDGRIYPVIKSCIKNRYRIITGIFSYYAFLGSTLSSGFDFLKGKFTGSLIPIIFILFIIHNFFNYRANVIEQYNLEKNDDEYEYVNLTSCEKFKILDMEIYFKILSILLTIAGYLGVIFFDCLK